MPKLLVSFTKSQELFLLNGKKLLLKKFASWPIKIWNTLHNNLIKKKIIIITTVLSWIQSLKWTEYY